MVRENYLTMILRFPQRFHDIVDDLHVQVIFRLIDDQQRTILESRMESNAVAC